MQFTKNQIQAIRKYIKDTDRMHYKCLHGTDSGHYLTSGESLIKIDDDSDNRIYPYDLFDKINKAMKKNDIAYIKEYALIDGTKIEYEPINEDSPKFTEVYPDTKEEYEASFSLKNLKHIIDFLEKYTNEDIIKIKFHKPHKSGYSVATFNCDKIAGLLTRARNS